MDDLMNPDITSDEAFTASVVASLSSLRAREWENYGYHRVYIDNGALIEAMGRAYPYSNPDNSFLDVQNRGSVHVGLDSLFLPYALEALGALLGFKVRPSGTKVVAKERMDAAPATQDERLDGASEVDSLAEIRRGAITRFDESGERFVRQTLDASNEIPVSDELLIACVTLVPCCLSGTAFRRRLAESNFPWNLLLSLATENSQYETRHLTDTANLGLDVSDEASRAALEFIAANATDPAFLAKAMADVRRDAEVRIVSQNPHVPYASLDARARSGIITPAFIAHTESTPMVMAHFTSEPYLANCLVESKIGLTAEQVKEVWPLLTTQAKPKAVSHNFRALTSEVLPTLLTDAGTAVLVKLLTHPLISNEVLVDALDDGRATVRAMATKELRARGVGIPSGK